MITKERMFAVAMVIIVIALIVAVLVAFLTTRVVITKNHRKAVVWLNRYNRLKMALVCTFFAGLAGICAIPAVMEFTATFVDELSKTFLLVYTLIIALSILAYGVAVYAIIETIVRVRKKALISTLKDPRA